MLIATSFNSFATSNSSQADLFSLDIAQLSQLEVTIASNTSETRATAPSTITVFDEQKISSLGIINAFDVLNFVPGMQMARGDWVGAVPKEHARGVRLDNGYLLILLDGVRLNESSFGKATVYTPFIAASILERVEIIRGPGSALYGSNAFLGVVNFITKKQHQQLTLSIGEHGYKALSGSYSHKQDDVTFNGNISLQQADGQSYAVTDNFDVKDPLKHVLLNAQLNYQDTKISFHFIENQLDEFINLGGYSNENVHKSQSFSTSLEHNLWQNERHTLDALVSYANFQIDSSGMVLPKEFGIVSEDFLVGPNWQTQWTKFSLSHSLKLAEDKQLNSGLEYRHASQYQAGATTNYYDYQSELIIPDDSNYLGSLVRLDNIPEFAALRASHDFYGVFSQLKWQLDEKWLLFIGARYDDIQGIDSKLSPRFSAIWKPINHHSFKLQYGESFRTPVNNELYSSDSVTKGNPNLTSEYVKTSELVWLYTDNNLSLETVIFHNQLRDFINLVPIEGNSFFTFDNTVNENITGVEFSASKAFSKLNVLVNYTQLFDEPINASFKRFANLSLRYPTSFATLYLNTIWRDKIEEALSEETQFFQASYSLVNFKMEREFGKQSVSLSAENLLDKEYAIFDPRVWNGAVPGKGRNLRVNYQFNFN
ncbi:TonB-dependent receptor plug domain-containing protein [Pseudoalteromonas sp. G4]|uniref:TonB-dependent receptor plug domain-containing protein n=1 Tax=Pseudoalteromonas sp. G4 TaxID=2992761 RepID=UPI00237E95DB|nr:TonB-dependent receptor [Pseudoalteromonas sp. G4]